MGKWWYNLRTQQVEPDDGGPNAERLGPFDTKEEATHALELAAKRNEEWESGEDKWDGPATDPVGDEWEGRGDEKGES